MVAFPDLVTDADASVVDALGVLMTVTTTLGQVSTVKGIFEKPFKHVDSGEAGVASTAPAAFFRLRSGTPADKSVGGVLNYLPVDPELEDNLRITYGGITYVVQESQPDGVGGVWLLMQKV